MWIPLSYFFLYRFYQSLTTGKCEQQEFTAALYINKMSYQEKTTKRILQLAKEGDFEACIELSSRYRTGTPMLEKNPVMADYWHSEFSISL